MGDISKNFSFSEFEYSRKAKENGIDNSIPSDAIRESIRLLVQMILQPLRDALEAPLHVNSGYRCEKLNILVNGTKTSQHKKGEAADIRTAFYSSLDVARKIVELELPFDQIVLYPDFVHVSHKCKGEQRGRILYDASYKGDNV